MPYSRTSLLGVAILAIAALVTIGYAEPASPESAPLQFVDLDGKAVDFADIAGDAATVVIFTRTDCPISNRYAPEVRRLYDEFHPRGVAFYLVYVDPREGPQDIRAHLKEYEYPCPALLDHDHLLVAATGATVTPEAVVFAANGTRTYRGRIDDLYADLGASRSAPTTHDLSDAIEATLADKPAADPETKAVGCLIADLK